MRPQTTRDWVAFVFLVIGASLSWGFFVADVDILDLLLEAFRDPLDNIVFALIALAGPVLADSGVRLETPLSAPVTAMTDPIGVVTSELNHPAPWNHAYLYPLQQRSRQQRSPRESPAMLQKKLLLTSVLGTLVFGAPPAFVQAQSAGETNPEAAASEEIAPGAQEQSEQEVPLAEVPEAAIAAAKGALKTEPKEAYLVTLMGGEEVYEIEATSADGEAIAVYVTPAGEIVERAKEEGETSQ